MKHWGWGILALAMSLQCLAEEAGKGFPVFAGTMVEMTWPEVKAAADRKSVVLLPVSVVEEHGPHMDLGPDIYISTSRARTVQEELVRLDVPAVVAPPYYWGINAMTGRFPGSFNLSPQTFRQVLFEIVENLKDWGFEEVYFVNGHGDQEHIANIDLAAREIREKLKIACVSLMSLPPAKGSAPAVEFIRLPWRDVHAGANETRLVYELAPDRVKIDMARGLARQGAFKDPLGYVGDPARFSEGNGLEIHQAHARNYALRIKQYRDMGNVDALSR